MDGGDCNIATLFKKKPVGINIQVYAGSAPPSSFLSKCVGVSLL